MSTMDAEKVRQAIVVMQAWLDGKVIQSRGTLQNERDWADMDCVGAPWCADVGAPLWNWGTCEYRIKPEARVLYFAEFSNGSLTSRPMNESEVAYLLNQHAVRSTRLVKFVEVME